MPKKTTAAQTPWGSAIPITGPVAEVLLALGHDHAPAPELVFPPLKRGTCAMVPLGSGGDFSLERRALWLDVTAAERTVWAKRRKMPNDRAADLQFTDGSRLTARFAHLQHRGTSLKVGSRPRHSMTFVLDVWEYTTATKPDVWVGELLGADVETCNVILSATKPDGVRDMGWSVLRLPGNYVWYLHKIKGKKRGEKRVIAVIDTGGAPLDAAKLAPDFRALEFCLGLPLRLDLLVGLARNLRVVAAQGPCLGFQRIGETLEHSPVPNHVRDRETWIPVLFEKVAKALDQDWDLMITPIDGYANSLADHVDGNYLKAQVALEAFCSALRKKPGVKRKKGGVLVKRPKAWLKWVKEHKDEIATFALGADVDADAARKLVHKVESAMQAPSTDAVEDILRGFGLEVPPDAIEELLGRNIATHQYRMRFKKPLADIERKVRTIHALLAVTVAKTVGYTGPIRGWARGALNDWEPLDWWAATCDPAEALRSYVCERPV